MLTMLARLWYCVFRKDHSYEYGRAVLDGEERTVRRCVRCGRRSAHSGDRTEPFDYWYIV